MRTVKNILETKPVPFNIISPDTLVIDALNLLNSVNLSYLIVMDKDKYKGIFCERDYSRNVILKGRTSSNTYVKEVMTVDLPVVYLTDTIEHCIKLLTQHKTRYLLAFDSDKKFAGVITVHDLLRSVISDREAIFDASLAQQLIDYEDNHRIY